MGIKKVLRQLVGKALIYVGSVGFSCCSWEGRPPRQISPANVDEPILTYCKKPCASAPLASCNRTAHTDDRINLSQSSRSSQRPRPVIGEILKKSLPFIIGRDFLQNVTIKLLSLCELSALCERPPHIPSLMHNLGPLPMRESQTGLSALGDSWIFMWFPKCPWSTRRTTSPTE